MGGNRGRVQRLQDVTRFHCRSEVRAALRLPKVTNRDVAQGCHAFRRQECLTSLAPQGSASRFIDAGAVHAERLEALNCGEFWGKTGETDCLSPPDSPCLYGGFPAKKHQWLNTRNDRRGVWCCRLGTPAPAFFTLC
jgi:hypothetical protein